MYCPECGKKLQPGDIFCLDCGICVEDLREPKAPASNDPVVDNPVNNNGYNTVGETVNNGYNTVNNNVDYSGYNPVDGYESNNPDDLYFAPTGDYAPGGSNSNVSYGVPSYQEPEVNKLPSVGSVVQTKKPNKLLLLVLPIVGVVIAVVLILIFALGGSSKEINLNDYISVTYGGYNGYGEANVTFDYERFCNENAEFIKYKSGSSGVPDVDAVVYFCDEMFLSFELSDFSNRSNGDIITLEWNLSPEIDDVFKIKCDIISDTKTFTVSGLTEVEQFDAFENVEVNLLGVAPYGYVEYNVNSTEEYMQYLDIVIDKYDGLSNDDTVTLSVELRLDTSEYISRFGMLPEYVEKSYKITGLPEYVGSVSKISSASFNDIKNASENAVYKHLNRNSASTERVNSVEYVGNYFQYTTENSITDTTNILTMVYRVNLYVDSASGGYSVTYYHIIRYYNLCVNADGICSINPDSYSEATDRYYPAELGGNYYYYGYETLAVLYEKLIDSNLYDYSYENNIIG